MFTTFESNGVHGGSISVLVDIFPIGLFIFVRGSRDKHSDLLHIPRKGARMLSMHLHSGWSSCLGKCLQVSWYIKSKLIESISQKIKLYINQNKIIELRVFSRVFLFLSMHSTKIDT